MHVCIYVDICVYGKRERKKKLKKEKEEEEERERKSAISHCYLKVN